MHIRKFDRDFSRRFFLEQLSKGVLATGVLTPLWPMIARGKTLEGVYPDFTPETTALRVYCEAKGLDLHPSFFEEYLSILFRKP